MLELDLLNVEAGTVRDNFQSILEYVKALQLENGVWSFYELDFAGAVTDYKFKHGLSYIPRDSIVVYKSTEAFITISIDESDKDNVYLTVTGPLKVRFYLGHHGKARSVPRIVADGTSPDLPGRLGDVNIDGGRPAEVYTPAQIVDGGTP